MIVFPKSGVKANGIDVMQFVTALFQILMEKNIVNENEIMGHMTKVGVVFQKQEVKTEQACNCNKCVEHKGILQ